MAILCLKAGLHLGGGRGGNPPPWDLADSLIDILMTSGIISELKLHQGDQGLQISPFRFQFWMQPYTMCTRTHKNHAKHAVQHVRRHSCNKYLLLFLHAWSSGVDTGIVSSVDVDCSTPPA